jgi:hypothetical protein
VYEGVIAGKLTALRKNILVYFEQNLLFRSHFSLSLGAHGYIYLINLSRYLVLICIIAIKDTSTAMLCYVYSTNASNVVS